MKITEDIKHLQEMANNIEEVVRDIADWKESSICAVKLTEFARDFLALQEKYESARYVIIYCTNNYAPWLLQEWLKYNPE